jgi:hypothetical protein
VDRDQLDRISGETGGASLYAPSEDDLARAYQSVAEWLKSFYLLTFISPQQAGPPQRILEVKAQHEGEELVGSTALELNLPPINAKLKNLEAGEDLEQEHVLQVETDRPEWVTEVAITVDGQTLASLSKTPFEVVLAPDNLGAGVHVVEVKIKDIIQREASLERTFRTPSSSASPPPPLLTESTPFWRVMLRWLYNNRLLPLGIAALVLSTIGLVRQIILRRRGIKCPSCQRRYRRHGACPHCSTHSKAQPKLLGQILLKSGLITTEQLDTTLAQQDNVKKMISDLIFEENLSEDQQERMRKWLGEIIVEQNLINKNDLRTALQLQTKHNAFASRLHRLFRERELAQSGRASFILYTLFYGAGGVAGGIFLYLYYLSTV